MYISSAILAFIIGFVLGFFGCLGLLVLLSKSLKKEVDNDGK